MIQWEPRSADKMDMRQAIFLDRDGVLIRTFVTNNVPHPAKSLDELEILPNVSDALALLHASGYLLYVVTNQPDVARGFQRREVVEQMNDHLRRHLPLDGIYACYHDNADQCACRKPAPGMILAAAKDHGIDLAASFMIGDRGGDIAAGAAAGCRTVLIDRPYSRCEEVKPTLKASDVMDAARQILRRRSWAGKPFDESGEADMSTLESFRVKIFADGADLAGMVEMAAKPHIAGLTTNPTLMRKAGVTDYRQFAMDVLAAIPDKPISFEVFSDNFEEMESQAYEIASWGRNVFVKIPVMNTRREPSTRLIRKLAAAGVKQNVTALMTLDQVSEVSNALARGPESYISVFAGRVADTGYDPVPMMAEAVQIMRPCRGQKLIWASPREVLNIFQADSVGCHIITVTNDLLKKLDLVGKNLHQYSLETVRMFHDDAARAGFTLPIRKRAAA